MEVQQQSAEPIGPSDKPIAGSLDHFATPFTGVLSEGSNAALRKYMGSFASSLSKKGMAQDYHCGAFEIDFDAKGPKLSELDEPVYEYPEMVGHPDSELSLAKLHFVQHGSSLVAPIVEVMNSSGLGAYLQSCLPALKKDWRLVISVNPYPGRVLAKVGLHMDQKNWNILSFALLYCNDDDMTAVEYTPRPQMYWRHMNMLRKNMPGIFFQAIEQQLKKDRERKLFAPTVRKHGFILAVDELFYHSTPFLHHRGAYSLELLLSDIDARYVSYFDAEFQATWRRRHPAREAASPAEAASCIEKLKALPREDPYLDLDKALLLLPNEDFREYLLGPAAPGVDPFEHVEIETPEPALLPVSEPGKPRITRVISQKLAAGEPVTRPASMDFLRLWFMVLPRHP